MASGKGFKLLSNEQLVALSGRAIRAWPKDAHNQDQLYECLKYMASNGLLDVGSTKPHTLTHAKQH